MKSFIIVLALALLIVPMLAGIQRLRRLPKDQQATIDSPEA
jgi:hypothetical protein